MSKYSTGSSDSETVNDGETIQYNGKRIGEIRYEKNQPVLMWGQHPLKMESTREKTAYSMSSGLVNKLEKLGVIGVYVSRKEYVPLSEFKKGRHIPPSDDRFENPPSEPQKVVYL